MSDRVPCLVEGCQQLRQRHEVMCRAHWRKVPIGLQQKIWQLYRTEPRGRRHLAAIRSAVALVERETSR